MTQLAAVFLESFSRVYTGRCFMKLKKGVLDARRAVAEAVPLKEAVDDAVVVVEDA